MQPQLKGALRGLNPSNVFGTASSEPSSHETRGARHGRAEVNYNMKYHPMDDVTRPKRARRMSGKQSICSSDNSGAEMALDDDESSDSDQGEELPAISERLPDPKAIRHSARSQAQKVINYSKRHHPQDYGLPGYQHLTRRQKRKHPKTTKQESSPGFESPAHGGDIPMIEISSDHESSDNASEEEPMAPPSPPRPRKQLKSLGRAAQSSSPKRPQKKSLTHDKPSDRVDDVISGRRLLSDDDDTITSSTSTLHVALAAHHTYLGANQTVPSATTFVVLKPYLKSQAVPANCLNCACAANQAERATNIALKEIELPPITSASINASLLQDASSSTVKPSEPMSETTLKEIQTPLTSFTSLNASALPATSSSTLRQSSGSTNNLELEGSPSGHFEEAMANTQTMQERMAEQEEASNTGFTLTQPEQSDYPGGLTIAETPSASELK